MLTANTTICKHFSSHVSAILGEQKILRIVTHKQYWLWTRGGLG